MGPVFVTGGSGFVGGAVVEGLVANGRRVRALARSDAAAERVEALGARAVRGSLADRASLLAGARGCVTIFHVAGVNAMCVRDPAPMIRANVDGSVAIVRAAAAAGIPRIVYTSSAATIGEPEGAVGTERTGHRGSFLSAYERSKFLAEREVLAHGEAAGVEVISVNPSSVQGPGRVEGSARLLLDLVNGSLPILVDTTVSIVDVRDCAAAHLLAETRGEPGARYLINGATITLREAVTLLRRLSGRPKRVAFAPRAVATIALGATRVTSRLCRDDPSLCPEMLRTLLHGHRYDGSLAERTLGLVYTPLDETVRRTLAWYAARGLAPEPVADEAEPTGRVGT